MFALYRHLYNYHDSVFYSESHTIQVNEKRKNTKIGYSTILNAKEMMI